MLSLLLLQGMAKPRSEADGLLNPGAACQQVHFVWLQAMVKKKTIPFVFHPELKTRFGILPRTAKDQQGIRWFEAAAMMMFHVAAAWEEGSLVKLYVCAWDKVETSLGLHAQ